MPGSDIHHTHTHTHTHAEPGSVRGRVDGAEQQGATDATDWIAALALALTRQTLNKGCVATGMAQNEGPQMTAVVWCRSDKRTEYCTGFCTSSVHRGAVQRCAVLYQASTAVYLSACSVSHRACRQVPTATAWYGTWDWNLF